MSQKKRKAKTTYYKYKSQTSGNLFHSPQAYGELIKIPMTSGMWAVSAASLIIQLGLTAFAVYAAASSETIPALENSGFSSSMIYLVLPVVTWILTLGFRFACSVVPLEMWRLPMTVRQGVIISEGQPLKLVTLLIELETAVCFVYIAAALYLGGSPSNLALLLWIAALVVSIYLPCRKAAELAKNPPARK